jgi:hypothetical protein
VNDTCFMSHVDAIHGSSQLNNWQFNSVIEVKLVLANADNYEKNRTGIPRKMQQSKIQKFVKLINSTNFYEQITADFALSNESNVAHSIHFSSACHSHLVRFTFGNFNCVSQINIKSHSALNLFKVFDSLFTLHLEMTDAIIQSTYISIARYEEN